MDLEAMQQAITRAMAANAEAALLAMHGKPVEAAATTQQEGAK